MSPPSNDTVLSHVSIVANEHTLVVLTHVVRVVHDHMPALYQDWYIMMAANVDPHPVPHCLCLHSIQAVKQVAE